MKTYSELTSAISPHVDYTPEINLDGSTTLHLPLDYVVTWSVTPWGAPVCIARREGRRASVRRINTAQDAETLAMSIARELRGLHKILTKESP